MNASYTTLSKRKVDVAKKEMTFLEQIYLPAIFKGMMITLKHFFSKKKTVQYPEVERPRAAIWRGTHVLKRDEEGKERCTACGLCALACPAEAISMVAAERQPKEAHLYREEKYAELYEINQLRCIYCGLCEDACPKAAIFLTPEITNVEYSRKDFIYGKDKLVEKVGENRIV